MQHTCPEKTILTCLTYPFQYKPSLSTIYLQNQLLVFTEKDLRDLTDFTKKRPERSPSSSSLAFTTLHYPFHPVRPLFLFRAFCPFLTYEALSSLLSTVAL